MLKIFEIKIYPFSPTLFSKKIQRAKDKFIIEHTNKTKQQLRSLYSKFYGEKIAFEDYSIGYIDVLYWGDCLHYEAHIMLSKKYPTRKTLKYIIDSLDDECFPDEDMKEHEALKRLQYSYSLVPYLPPLFTEKKHYMKNYHIEGLYTGIMGQTNCEIAENIRRDINEIQNRDLFRNLYFDLSLFDTIGNNIDYLAIFEKSH